MRTVFLATGAREEEEEEETVIKERVEMVQGAWGSRALLSKARQAKRGAAMIADADGSVDVEQLPQKRVLQLATFFRCV